jgi:hypothetical protein
MNDEIATVRFCTNQPPALCHKSQTSIEKVVNGAAPPVGVGNEKAGCLLTFTIPIRANCCIFWYSDVKEFKARSSSE